jgi:protein subunit release factor B
MFSVSKEKEQDLLARMERLGIREEDLVEKFIRAGGKGGQKVNKTSSCVYLKHIPTQTEVKTQKDRSQAVNRYLARRLLCDKIEEERMGRESKQRQAIEKIRRQKRKRSKRAKEKILKNKKILSAKKDLRSPPDWEAE